MTRMRVEVLKDGDAVFRRAATFIAERVRSCVDERGEFSLALSGGRGQPLLELLDAEDVTWDAVSVFQVDEQAVADVVVGASFESWLSLPTPPPARPLSPNCS